MKIRNMGQKYVTPKVRNMARPVPPVARRATLQNTLLLLLLSGQATYLPTSDLKARGFLWSTLLLYFLGLKSL